MLVVSRYGMSITSLLNSVVGVAVLWGLLVGCWFLSLQYSTRIRGVLHYTLYVI